MHTIIIRIGQELNSDYNSMHLFKDKDFLLDDATYYTAPKIAGNGISIELGRIINGEDEHIAFLKDITIYV